MNPFLQARGTQPDYVFKENLLCAENFFLLLAIATSLFNCFVNYFKYVGRVVNQPHIVYSNIFLVHTLSLFSPNRIN